MILPTISLKIERWKFNKEYGIYVSTLGNFKDRYKRRLPIKIDQGGYCRVKTEVPKTPWKLTHRLVMLTWKPIPEAENLTVDHLNHNKRDNSLANLEWVTGLENQKRAVEDYLPICTITQTIWQFKVGNNPTLYNNANEIWSAYQHCFSKEIRELRKTQLEQAIKNIMDGSNSATIKRIGNKKNKIIVTGVKKEYDTSKNM